MLGQAVKKFAVTAKTQSLTQLHDKGSGHKILIRYLLNTNPARTVFDVLDDTYNHPVLLFRKLVCKKVILITHLHPYLSN